MSSRTPQRAVYLVTVGIVAAMVAGFALAELAGSFTTQSVTGQNVGTVQCTSPCKTMYGAGFTVTLAASANAPGGGCQSGTIAGSTPVSNVETDNIYVAGASNICTSGSGGDWYEEVAFSTVTGLTCSGIAPSCTDTFTFATTGGTNSVAVFVLTLHSGSSMSEALTVYVDDGATASAGMPISITSIGIVASGS
jgi:hypothetical protein